MRVKMKKKNLNLNKREFKEMLGVKEITYGEFLGHVWQLMEYLQKNKNYNGLSVLHQLMPPGMMEDLIVQYIAAQQIKDGLSITNDGNLAIRDIT